MVLLPLNPTCMLYGRLYKRIPTEYTFDPNAFRFEHAEPRTPGGGVFVTTNNPKTHEPLAKVSLRHSGESRNPDSMRFCWSPAFAGAMVLGHFQERKYLFLLLTMPASRSVADGTRTHEKSLPGYAGMQATEAGYILSQK